MTMRHLSPYRALLRTGMRWCWDRLIKLRPTLQDIRKRLPAPVKRVIRRVGRITAGTFIWVIAGIAGMFVAAHFWLPTLTERKSDIETYLTTAIGNRVELGELQTFWDGLNPGVRVQDLRVLTETGEPALRLREAQLSLLWRALLLGKVEINKLILIGPRLSVERQADGAVRVTGLAAQDTTATAVPDFTAWLLRQRLIVIVDGELQWVDHVIPAGRDEAERMAIRSATISIQNEGARHDFSLRAQFPEEVCNACQISGYVRGNPLVDADWSGELRVESQVLELENLPRVVRQQLPAGLTGTVGAALTGRWQKARLEEISGRVRAQDLSVPVGGKDDVLTLRLLDTGLNWRRESKRWRLELEPLRLASTDKTWQAGRVEIEAREDGGQIRVEHVNLGEVAGVLAGFSRVEAIRPWLSTARPGGWMHQLKFLWSGSISAPDDYQLEARLAGLYAEASDRVPGINGLSGKLRLTPEEGELRLDSRGGRLDVPRVMYNTIPFARLAGRVRWRRDPEGWWVQAGGIEMRNADARVSGDVELRFPEDRSQSPVVKLKMSLRDGKGESVERYFPRVTPDRLREYLSRAIQGGRVTQANVVLQGALRNFPFRDGKGKFEVRAHIEDGQLEFMPGWLPLRNLDVDARFTGTGMLLTADTGKLQNLRVSRVAVEIEDFLAPQGVMLAINGHASGAVNEAVTVLQDSPLQGVKSWLIPGVNVSGLGTLDLDLRIPLRTASVPLLDGEYRVSSGRVSHASLPQAVESVRGMIGFDQNGLRRGRLDARWLGSPLEFVATPTKNSGANMTMRGAVDAGHLPDVLGAVLARQVNGPVPWQLQWLSGADRHWLTLNADIKDVEVNLPVPLEKPRGEPLQLEVRSNGVENNAMLVDWQVGNRAAGKLAWQKTGNQWSFHRGRVAVGERTVPLPTQDGLHFSARLPELNLDRWWPVLQPALSGAGKSAEPSPMQRLTLDVAALYFLDRSLGRLNVDMAHREGVWSGQLDGDAVVGHGRVTPARSGDAASRTSLQFSLARLVVPPASADAKPGIVDPRNLPELQVKSESFHYAQYDFGALELHAEPSFAGWRIAMLRMVRPETDVQVSGQWSINRQGKQSSRFDLELNSTDIGESLKAFGFGDELVGGAFNMRSSWNWPGPPGDFALANLSGQTTLDLREGRLPRISPGAGRLLGAFDMRSVTRILTLNFSSLVAKGLSFDRLHGALEVNNGNAYTRNLELLVPGADIEMRGRIGLATRDLDMEMFVTPRVSTNLAPVIGGTILGGPVVGGAIAVLGGVTRKPFEKSTRIEYRVDGGWDDPKVKQITKLVEPADGNRPE